MTKATLAVVSGLNVNVEFAGHSGLQFDHGIIVDLNSIGVTLKTPGDRMIFIPMHRIYCMYEKP